MSGMKFELPVKMLLAGIIVGFVFYSSPAKATELIMFSQAGCAYCDRWNEEVGFIYSKTEEAKIAKFRELDIHKKWPVEFRNIKPIIYTPTFVIIDRGQEIGRILGYISEDFFWGHLNRILGKIPRS